MGMNDLEATVMKLIRAEAWTSLNGDFTAHTLPTFAGLTADRRGLIFRGEINVEVPGLYQFTTRFLIVSDESDEDSNFRELRFTYTNKRYEAYWIAVEITEDVLAVKEAGRKAIAENVISALKNQYRDSLIEQLL